VLQAESLLLIDGGAREMRGAGCNTGGRGDGAVVSRGVTQADVGKERWRQEDQSCGDVRGASGVDGWGVRVHATHGSVGRVHYYKQAQ
jgi:hypothetical protein